MHKSGSPGPSIHLGSLGSNTNTGSALQPTTRPSLTSLPASSRYTPSLGVTTTSPFASSLLTNIPPSSHRPSPLLPTMQRSQHLSPPPIQLKHEQTRFNSFTVSPMPPLIPSLPNSPTKLNIPETLPSTAPASLPTPLSHPFSGSFLAENLIRSSSIPDESRTLSSPFLSSSNLSIAAHQVIEHE